MKEVVRRYPWPGEGSGWADLLTQEWLVTNGLGGYASGTVCGVPTRRFHGLLIAALPAPLGRTMMLNDVAEEVDLPDGSRHRLGGEEHEATTAPLPGTEYLREFRLDAGLPVWVFGVGPVVVEKRVALPYRQNTVHVHYRNARRRRSGAPAPPAAVHFRPHEAPLDRPIKEPYVLTAVDRRYEISARRAPAAAAPAASRDCRPPSPTTRRRAPRSLFRVEESRGYDARGTLWSAGYFEVDARARAGSHARAPRPSAGRRSRPCRPREVLQFEHDAAPLPLDCRAHPGGRPGGGRARPRRRPVRHHARRPHRRTRRARAPSGDEVRTVIAGYHWFTDWGRDTMISLEGLTLATGRHQEAGWILRTFAHYVRDGLIPNLFPEGENQGLYHTADATLWFFHAVDRYVERHRRPRHAARSCCPILARHRRAPLEGTRFGIGVDPADGLLRQGAGGLPAHLDGRQGGRLGGHAAARQGGRDQRPLVQRAAPARGAGRARRAAPATPARLGDAGRARVPQSFNERFWYAEGGYLYDVVDGEAGGNDPACRPNQVFAISLRPPRARPRALGGGDGGGRSSGCSRRSACARSPPAIPTTSRTTTATCARATPPTTRARSGPGSSAPSSTPGSSVHPGDAGARPRVPAGFVPHLGEACVGSISEIFDAEAPYTPRGCVAQAWSVAEVLRCWVKTRG